MNAQQIQDMKNYGEAECAECGCMAENFDGEICIECADGPMDDRWIGRAYEDDRCWR